MWSKEEVEQGPTALNLNLRYGYKDEADLNVI
jgi:hypothetical protein